MSETIAHRRLRFVCCRAGEAGVDSFDDDEVAPPLVARLISMMASWPPAAALVLWYWLCAAAKIAARQPIWLPGASETQDFDAADTGELLACAGGECFIAAADTHRRLCAAMLSRHDVVSGQAQRPATLFISSARRHQSADCRRLAESRRKLFFIVAGA